MLARDGSDARTTGVVPLELGNCRHGKFSPRAHFGQPLVCRTVRSSNEPRSNSPVTGTSTESKGGPLAKKRGTATAKN